MPKSKKTEQVKELLNRVRGSSIHQIKKELEQARKSGKIDSFDVKKDANGYPIIQMRY